MTTITRPGIEMTAVEIRRDFPVTRNPCQVLACRNRVSIFRGGRWIRPIPRGGVAVMSTRRGDEANEPTAERRTAQIPRSPQDGNLCHDNKTATAVEDRVGRCDESAGANSIVVPFTN